MAIMRPEKPREFDVYSLEDIMFDALSKLSNEYYVFHSFKIVTVSDDNFLKESETDFVIFNPDKGIICLEAKAGSVYCENETWYYGSGKKMSHDGPYRQAANNKWKLRNYIEDNGMYDIINNCKFLHAVWFPCIDNSTLMSQPSVSDFDRKITLTKEALDNIEYYIERIYKINVGKSVVTNLQAYQIKRLLESILSPTFKLIPSLKSKVDLGEKVFFRMLSEQVNILNYLEEQPVAAINGVAGSGKTLIALEKARRSAEKGEKVLFLCFNRFLKDYLKENYRNDNIDFYTLDGLSCKLCKSDKPDMYKLKDKVIELFVEEEFPYKHIIIDEGQDFGQEDIVNSEIIEELQKIVLDDTINGSFYIFYDRLQLVQGNRVPQYIMDADCRLTLYKNCRNTKNIATTSVRPFPNLKRNKMSENSIAGNSPEIFFSDNDKSIIMKINERIEEYWKQKITDIVILTCETEDRSILSKQIKDEDYICNGKRIKFTTCRKFKGLEANVVFLVDINKDMLTMKDETRIFYVGASRAKFELNIFAQMNSEQCNEVLESYGKERSVRPEKALAAFLNAKKIK